MNIIPVNFKSVRRIVSLADIHIRLVKRKDEYEAVFQTLYDELKNSDLSDTVITVLGDLLHSKVELSPESLTLASDFLRNLANLAPILVIAGNHDAQLNSTSRMDSLSPVITNLNHPNLYYLKDSGIYTCSDVDFYVWSVFGDQSEWPTPQSDDRTKICLIHAPIHNAKTDVGYTVTNRHVMIEMFDGFDAVMAGDIHKMQVLQEYDPVNKKPVINYQSSLIQQNHGENPREHGYCDWDVKSRSFTFKELHNEYGYYTLRVENGVVPSYDDMPKKVRLRIFAGSLEQSEIKKLVATIRSSHDVKELSVTSFDGIKRKNSTVDVGESVDILDVDVQNGLITNFLKEVKPELSDDTLQRVVELNKKANLEISTEDITRKIEWTPLSLKFDNVFSYGEGNYVDLTKLNGVVGIFAPNRHGKTSMAEVICFALYDRTPRTNRAINIMNYTKDKCYVEFKFSINDEVYTVIRKGERNKKGEVKIDVDFSKIENGVKISLNGEQRVYTNQNIRSYVGDYEDFILTTFSSSSSQGLYMDRGQSDRKDLLSQFMGLTILDKLHKFANEESKGVAGALKRFKSDDFTQELVDVNEKLTDLAKTKKELEESLEAVNEKLNEFSILVQNQYERKIPVSFNADIHDLINSKEAYETKLKDIISSIETTSNKEADLNDKLERGRNKLSLEYQSAEEDYQLYQELAQSKVQVSSDIQTKKRMGESYQTQYDELSKHEYDPNCEFCVKNGHSTISTKEELAKKIDDNKKYISSKEIELSDIEKKLTSLGDIQEKHKKYQTGKQWIQNTQQEVIQLLSFRSKFEAEKSTVERNISDLSGKIEEYYKSQDAIEFNKTVDEAIRSLELEKSKYKGDFTSYTYKINQVTSEIAVMSQKKADMLHRIDEAKELEETYEAYEAYLIAVGRDGLSYKLISEMLPALESSVNHLLQQIAEFSLKFETDGKNIIMKIVYENGNSGSLDMASGMEKFISSLAIRAALSSISSLPKCNGLIVDEGLGTLDGDNLSSLSLLFDVLKLQYDWILLISHVDAVRDMVDNLIEINRINGNSIVQFQ